MGEVNVNAELIEKLIKYLDKASQWLDGIRKQLQTKYVEAGNNGRKDSNYQALGRIVADCNQSYITLEKSFLQTEKTLLQIRKAIQEYESVNLVGGSESGTEGGSGAVSSAGSGGLLNDAGTGEGMPSSVADTQPAATQTSHRKMLEGEDRIDAIISDMKQGGGVDVSREEAKVISQSIFAYSGMDYKGIRGSYKNPEFYSEFAEKREAIDTYLHNAPKWEGGVFRGIGVSRSVADRLISGEPIDMLGPSSWSTSERTAQNFAYGDVNMVFVLNENRSGASITHLSVQGDWEEEVLAPSGVQYHMDRYEQRVIDGRDFIYVYVNEEGDRSPR